MIDWRQVLFALGVGMGLVLLSEGVWQWRRRGRYWVWWVIVLMVGIGVLLAVGGWQLGQGERVVEDAMWGEDVSVGALPPPRIEPFGLDGRRAVETAVLVDAVVVDEVVEGAVSVEAVVVEAAYLRIPSLEVAAAVGDIAVRDGVWDVSQLGDGVGRLATTGIRPADEWAMVLAGHMSFPSANLLQQGAFAALQYVQTGSDVFYEVGDVVYHYQVESVRRIAPDAVDALYVADGSRLLLVTCTDWDEAGRLYSNRLLVTAVMVAP